MSLCCIEFRTAPGETRVTAHVHDRGAHPRTYDLSLAEAEALRDDLDTAIAMASDPESALTDQRDADLTDHLTGA